MGNRASKKGPPEGFVPSCWGVRIGNVWYTVMLEENDRARVWARDAEDCFDSFWVEHTECTWHIDLEHIVLEPVTAPTPTHMVLRKKKAEMPRLALKDCLARDQSIRALEHTLSQGLAEVAWGTPLIAADDGSTPALTMVLRKDFSVTVCQDGTACEGVWFPQADMSDQVGIYYHGDVFDDGFSFIHAWWIRRSAAEGSLIFAPRGDSFDLKPIELPGTSP